MAAISIGEAQGHGLTCDAETLRTVLVCALESTGGVRVTNRHTDDVFETVGLATNWRIDGTVLRCDVEFLEAVATRADAILELADRAPETFGMSITFHATSETVGTSEFLRCAKLVDVAIVSEPAANRGGLLGLSTKFSAISGGQKQAKTMTYTPEETASKLDALTAGLAELKALLAPKADEVSELAAKLATSSDAVAALAAKVDKELISFGTRAGAIEQQISKPKPVMAPELVSFAAKVAEKMKLSKLSERVAISRVSAEDYDGNRAWLNAGQPALA